jgi:uncharacterized protein YndB with AHSA1/START domain
VTTAEQAATPDDVMTKSKTTLRYHIQASLNGGTWYDTDTKGFTSRDKAERVHDRILRDAYPTWRGLSLVWRVVRRKTTVTADTRIEVFATPSRGKKRSLLGEMFVPSWLPKRQKERLKMRRIPDAPEQWQPTSQLPIPQPENK